MGDQGYVPGATSPQFPLHSSHLPSGAISPYLAIDPSIFKSSEPQYILPEGSGPKRGRFELAFSEIGSGVLLGGALGSGFGAFKGLSDPSMKQLSRTVYRTQMLNYLVKHSSAGARPCGILMMYFAGFDILISKLRGCEDEFNPVASGALTGALYRSFKGLRSTLFGTSLGAGAGLAWVLLDSKKRENLSQIFKSIFG